MNDNSQFYSDFLMSLPSFSEKMNQDGIFALLNELNNFHNTLKVIHIAGTNGKGSTATMLSSIYHKAGYNVGAFISPYFADIRECIFLNNIMIDVELMNTATKTVAAAYERLRIKNAPLPTHYECITVVALLVMKIKEVDLCFVEALMGGKDDATNIFSSPLLTIITAISYDHTEYLGSRLSSIAGHKAGIIKKNVPVIVNKNTSEALNTIMTRANELNAPLVQSWDTQSEISLKFFSFLTLRGSHQYENLLGVLTTINTLNAYYPVSQEQIIAGLSSVVHPCRLEQLSIDSNLFLLDGSHNLQGIEALEKYIHTYLENYKRIFIFGILKDKDIESILPIISHLAYKLILVTPQSPRALDGDSIFSRLNYEERNKTSVAASIEDALKLAKRSTEAISCFGSNNEKQATCIVACGSFTVSFPVRNLILKSEI